MMKKQSLIFLLSFLFATYSNAQVFDKGKTVISAGYGVPNLSKDKLETAVLRSANEKYRIPEVKTKGYGTSYLKVEYGLSKHIGMGIVLSHWQMTVTGIHKRTQYSQVNPTGSYWYDIYTDYENITTVKFSNLSAGLRFNFHFLPKEKFDPYIGLAAGYSNLSYSTTFSTNDPYYDGPAPKINLPRSPFYYSGTIGFRCYFNEHIGMYAELGYDQTPVQLGIAFKF